LCVSRLSMLAIVLSPISLSSVAALGEIVSGIWIELLFCLLVYLCVHVLSVRARVCVECLCCQMIGQVFVCFKITFAMYCRIRTSCFILLMCARVCRRFIFLMCACVCARVFLRTCARAYVFACVCNLHHMLYSFPWIVNVSIMYYSTCTHMIEWYAHITECH
jgi:hypothetical protein